MSILITGAGGYLGSELTWRFLQEGYNVTAIDKLIFNQGDLVANILTHPNCEFYNLDVMEIPDKILKSCDVIYPLAALVGMPICKKDIKETYRVNTESIKWLTSKVSKNQRIIFPNTNSGYGTAGNNICDESTPLASISDYGRSKELAEKILREMPNATIYRLATVYGPSWRPRLDLLVNFFVYHAVHDNKLEIYEGNFNRNFVHIDDVIDIFFKSKFLSPTFGNVFNLGQDKDNMSKSQLINIIKGFFHDLKITYSKKEDPDKRNYLVSSDKLSQYLKVKHTIVDKMPELIKFFKLMPTDPHLTKSMKNV